ncbi:MAG: sugar phosphate isomerase/epimerase family protein [Planctomycetota bacterium]|jgi:sugar phosphate isomerase/epimerase
MSWTAAEIASRVGASTNLFFWEKVRLGAEQIAQLAAAGIRRLELAGDMGQFDPTDANQIAEIKAACDEHGVSIVSYHCPDLPWDDWSAEARTRAMGEFLGMCEAAQALGGPLMVCHFQMDEETEHFIRYVLQKLAGTGVRLTIENGEDLQEYADFVDRIDSPQFGMIVDIGHAKDSDGRNPFTCPDRARETIRACEDRLFHLHLHEFWDGADHWPPFYKGGLIEWGELFAGLADIAYPGALMFESVPAIPNDPASFADHLRTIATFPDEFVRRYGE